MSAMIDAAKLFLLEFIAAQPDAPAADLEGAEELAAALDEVAPEEPGEFEELLQTVSQGAAKALNTTGPGYMAYIPGGGLFAAALADFLACGVNRFVNLAFAAPVFAQIEATVIRWLDDLFGYPPESLGIFTSGGSMANFSSIVAARKFHLEEDFSSGALYVGEQVHLSVAKAAILAGFHEKNVRVVPCTSDLSMDVDALRTIVKEDRAAGLRPFYVVASAGTTNTGTVDPILEIARVASEERLWFHVDGAYGGFFQLTERGRSLFRGIENADSITLDPHKGMFLPYGTGCLLVRDRARLREAHHFTAEYLQDLAGDPAIPNFNEYSPELSRDFRGLRVWLPVKLHGLGAFRTALDEKLDLARYVYECLRDAPGFELPWEPDLSTVAFRYRPSRGDPDEFGRRLLDRINQRGRIFLSSTSIGGRFTIRVSILSHRTHRDRVEEAVEIIRNAAADLEA